MPNFKINDEGFFPRNNTTSIPIILNLNRHQNKNKKLIALLVMINIHDSPNKKSYLYHQKKRKEKAEQHKSSIHNELIEKIISK